MGGSVAVRDVSANYNGREVLKKINFDISDGEFLGIVGPNGAGKSTLFKIISGIHRPTEGDVKINGISTHEYERRLLARSIAYMPQLNEILFPFTCFDIVMIGRTPYLSGLMLGGKNDREIVRKAMEDTDCWEFRERDINSISVGERQRVFVARALATEPEIMLLDEPVSSLDLKHMVAIYRLLAALNIERKITIVTVSHNLNIVSQFVNRIFVLHNGEILAEGMPEKILNRRLLQQIYGDTFDIIQNSSTGRPAIIPRFK